jgi:hypothetical protein
MALYHIYPSQLQSFCHTQPGFLIHLREILHHRKVFMLRSCDIETIKVHHFGPGCHEVLDKLLLTICASIDLGQCPELGVRTEDEIDTRAGPPGFASLAIVALEHVGVFRYRLPLRAHVKQVDKEVVGERFRRFGKNAVPGLSEVGVQHTHTANEHRHLGRG